ncbi:heat-inducible transcriptional repressor HrcA [Anaerofustis stercorihominis]|uniref:Heat-inducible transcription repressor HrcA n=2 Tax=Anaerofustis stercorihominis TaxID=214853 RepID=B1CBN3_9FIRM|nr:heat-inducible transcriptional repressor HrcA [Anaerofustis stercorihominis]EDS71680.1 heat-inducible transcription repressor HrcA [Anaerofustis stercorihominis DSM 17244]MCQ4796262.1 heat-inducible transcriptional repressor HrcA [Anaerofustis stercorihominis]RGD75248.1 heat-inducible transcription repressor HrcA [Anaerofustis stercorihominis]
MNWDDRKFNILRAIINDYIKTAEPVGSRTLEKKYNLGVSSATIRNEMSDLEEMGFLIKPHTSAGRIPSTSAYRLYVDNFMKKNALESEIREAVRAEYDNYMLELNNTIEKTLNILTKMTNYTSLVMAPRLSSLNVKDVKIVYIEEDRVMLIVVTKEGLIKNSEIRLKTYVTLEEIERINNALTTIIKNRPANEAVNLLSELVEGLSETENRILSEIMPVFRSLVENTNSSKIYARGVSKILNFPEFGDIERAKHFIDSVNSKEALESAISVDSDDSDIHIVIGNENKVEDFNDCSIITANYKLNGKTVGTIGVIGPTRMNYDYAVSTLDFLSDELTKHITKIFKK